MASVYSQNNVLGMDALEVYNGLSDPLIDNDIGLSSSDLNAHRSNYGARLLRKHGLFRVVTWSSLEATIESVSMFCPSRSRILQVMASSVHPKR
jgi:hypothetical protein